MKRMIGKAALAASCSALLFSTPSAAEPEVGTVAQRQFLGALGTRESGERRNLYFNNPVYSNEQVETGARTTTNLVFLDNTNLFVGANSSVVLDKFVYDPEQRLGDVAISFGKGAFRFITGEIENKEDVSLRTPTATMTIRGTELVIFVLEDGTTEVNVLEGAVDLLPCEAEETTRVESGQAMLISATCETAQAEARPMPFGDEYPRLPPEFAALDDSIEPAAGGSAPGGETKRGSGPRSDRGPAGDPGGGDDGGDGGDSGDGGEGGGEGEGEGPGNGGGDQGYN